MVEKIVSEIIVLSGIINRGYHASVFGGGKYPALGINIVFSEPWRAKYIVFIPNSGYLPSPNTQA